MSTVRAKFTCNGVTRTAHWDKAKAPFLYQSTFTPVIGGSKENDSFFASTPLGEIKMGGVGEDFFEPGAEYYVIFEKVQKEPVMAVEG